VPAFARGCLTARGASENVRRRHSMRSTEEMAERLRRVRGPAVGVIGALAIAGAVAGCGADRTAAGQRAGSAGQETATGSRVLAAERPGPHSGLATAPAAQPKVSYFACTSRQGAPVCTAVAGSGSEAPPEATEACSNVGTYQSCIPLGRSAGVAASISRARRLGRGFICRAFY
jgi:hypothetical protein